MAKPASERATLTAFAWPSPPFCVAAGIYTLLLILGDRLLNDPDSYWHLVLGQWIASHLAFPHVDTFSSTMSGSPWIAKEWLSQVVYAGAYAIAGWTAVVVLTASAIALTFALLARLLLDRLAVTPAVTLTIAAFTIASPHLVARPHVLALPIMVAWVGSLVRALDQGRRPSLALLPLMTLWANLHGGFTLGLALIAPIAFEAVWNAPHQQRRSLALQWLRFSILALLAACITPYGPESILVTYRILSLGPALSIIGEWQPQDFSAIKGFELCLLLGIGFACYRGLRLPPMRILMILGLLHLALAHVRNAEILGLLAPLFLAAPLSRQLEPKSASHDNALPQSSAFSAAGLTALLGLATVSLVAARPLAPNENITPAAAVEVIKQARAGPILNDYNFGGYLIYAGLAPFIDGRTELYGGAFTVRHHRAVTLQDVPDFFRLIDKYRIGVTLLKPGTPAVGLLDHSTKWKRIYADTVAVVHVRQEGNAAIDAPDMRASRD